MLSQAASLQTPPDLPSYVLKERIVYLAMTLVPQVTELILAELLYLQFDEASKPIHLYVNSTGVPSGLRRQDKLGYETEAFSIYDTMRSLKPEIRTMAIGSAWGEAALLLTAGKIGQRTALCSSSIMIRQPMRRITQMQASDISIYRNQFRQINLEIIQILSNHTGNPEAKIANDIRWLGNFDPSEAVE
jgi:ATP-dependent Clp protease protease subunit